MNDSTMRARYKRALTLEQFVSQASANQELWTAHKRRCTKSSCCSSTLQTLELPSH